MKTNRNTSIFWVGLAGLLILSSLANTADVLPISIVVSPNVLNLQNQGQVVTVHTDIDFGLVLAAEVYLNGVQISSWKADNRGNFVAKFLIDEIKALDLNIGGYNTLTLTGWTIDGDPFCGSDEILVVNNGPGR